MGRCQRRGKAHKRLEYDIWNMSEAWEMPLPTLHSHPGTTSLGSYLSCKKNMERCKTPLWWVSFNILWLYLSDYQTADVWNGLDISEKTQNGREIELLEKKVLLCPSDSLCLNALLLLLMDRYYHYRLGSDWQTKLFCTSPKELVRGCNLGKTQKKKAVCDFDGQLPEESPHSRTAK